MDFNLFNFLNELNFLIKVFFILFLFFSHVVLLLISNNKNNEYLQAGISDKLLNTLKYGGSILGIISSYYTIKNEYYTKSSEQLAQAYQNQQIELDAIIDKNKILELKLKELKNETDFITNASEYLKTNFTNTQGLLREYTELVLQIKTEAKNNNMPVSELQKLIEKQKILDIKIGHELTTFEESLKIGLNHSKEQIENLGISLNYSNENKIENNDSILILNETKKSSILDLDLDWFESLSGIKKLAISLLLMNSVLFSCLLNLIFIFYGDILIKKFNLELRYPNLAKIIKLRQLFNKYYLIINCLLIFGIILAQLAFSIAILLL